MTLHPRQTTTIVSTIALIVALTGPVFAQDAMSATPSDAMSTDSMMSDSMMADDMAMANDAMAMGDAMTGGGKTIMITIENLLTGQPFSPSFFEARTTGSAPLFTLGDKASDAVVAVAEGGNIGMLSVGAAMNKDAA